VVTPVIPALGRLKQEDGELEASLGYIGRLSKKKKVEDFRVSDSGGRG
jgi:hypothetical protein